MQAFRQKHRDEYTEMKKDEMTQHGTAGLTTHAGLQDCRPIDTQEKIRK